MPIDTIWEILDGTDYLMVFLILSTTRRKINHGSIFVLIVFEKFGGFIMA